METRECASCDMTFKCMPTSQQYYHSKECTQDWRESGKKYVIRSAVIVLMDIVDIGKPSPNAKYEHFQSVASRFPAREFK